MQISDFPPLSKTEAKREYVQVSSEVVLNFQDFEIKKLVAKFIKEKHLNYPFDGKINPHAELAQAESIEWVKKFKLASNEEMLQILRMARFAYLMARAHPNCDLNKLKLTAEYATMLFINDDQNESLDPKNLEEINKINLKALAGSKPVESDTPLAHGIYDLITRVKIVAKDAWMERFKKHIYKHFNSTIWESENRELQITPDLETYIKQRRQTGAVAIVLDLIEIVEETNIPNNIFKKHLKILNQASKNIISWSNDIFSLPKEMQGKGRINNIVLVLMKEFNCSLEEGIMRAADLHNQEIEKFLKAKEELFALCEEGNPELKECKSDIEKYVNGLSSWMNANYEWSKETARYN